MSSGTLSLEPMKNLSGVQKISLGRLFRRDWVLIGAGCYFRERVLPGKKGDYSRRCGDETEKFLSGSR